MFKSRLKREFVYPWQLNQRERELSCYNFVDDNFLIMQSTRDPYPFPRLQNDENFYGSSYTEVSSI